MDTQELHFGRPCRCAVPQAFAPDGDRCFKCTRLTPEAMADAQAEQGGAEYVDGWLDLELAVIETQGRIREDQLARGLSDGERLAELEAAVGRGGGVVEPTPLRVCPTVGRGRRASRGRVVAT